MNSRVKYILLGIIIFLISSLYLTASGIVSNTPRLQYAEAISGHYSIKNIYQTFLGSLLGSLLITSFIIPLLVLIYYSRKYYLKYEKINLHLRLSLVSLITTAIVTVILAILIGLACDGEGCMGVVSYLLYMVGYLVGVIILSLLAAWYVNKKHSHNRNHIKI